VLLLNFDKDIQKTITTAIMTRISSRTTVIQFFALMAAAAMTMSTAMKTHEVNADQKIHIHNDRQLEIGDFPTAAPVEAEETAAPTNPDLFVCSICGDGREVTMPDGVVSIPAQGEFTCSELEESASMGLISPAQCLLVFPFVQSPCGCEDSGSDPVPAPTDTPADPTPSPSDPPVESTPEPTTTPSSAEDCSTIGTLFFVSFFTSSFLRLVCVCV
jgi:hypothetical protein